MERIPLESSLQQQLAYAYVKTIKAKVRKRTSEEKLMETSLEFTKEQE